MEWTPFVNRISPYISYAFQWGDSEDAGWVVDTPPENGVIPPIVIPPTGSPGINPKVVSEITGLRAVVVIGAPSITSFQPARKSFTVFEPNIWVSSKVAKCRSTWIKKVFAPYSSAFTTWEPS